MSSRPAVALAASLALAASAGRAIASEPAAGGDGAFPTIVITRDQLLASGASSIGEYLQALPIQGNALNAQTTGEGDGAVTVNLRSLGPGRTLVLVDGRRVAPGGGRLALGSDVDLYVIPLHAVERIEVLDGVGSAVHGSEAMAGVLNVITRRGLEGTEAAATVGTTSRGDATAVDVSVISGVRGDRGGLVLGVGYATVGAVLDGDRAWASPRHGYDYATGTVGPPVVSTVTPAGRFQLDPATCATSACAALLGAYGAGDRAWTADPSLPGGARPYADADGYDAMAARQLQAPSRRVTAHAAGELALGSAAQAYLEASYANRTSSEQVPPFPLDTRLYLPVGVSAQSAYNPYGVDLADVRRRLVELGPRRQAYDFDTFRAVAGVRGTLPEGLGPLRGWSWDTAFEYGRTAGTSTSSGELRLPSLEAALGPSYLDPSSGDVRCGTPGNDVPGCVPLDLLHGPGSITPAQLAGVAFSGVDASAAQLWVLGGSLRGEPFALQAGHPATLTLGVEVRDQSGSFTPDPVVAAGESSGGSSVAVSGRYDAQEVFAELRLPVWSGAPGLERLDVTLAGRLFHFSTFGTDAVYQLGFRYAPLTWLTVRAGASTAYRAPGIEELYRPAGDAFPVGQDPCSGVVTGGGSSLLDPTSGLYAQCNATGEAQGAPPGRTANNGDVGNRLPSRVGGNPRLGPETARRIGLGLVVEPLPRLSLALDYSRLRLDRAVNQLGAQAIVDACFTASPAPGTAATASSPQHHCGLIRRDPTNGQITLVDDALQNDGGSLVSALDLAAAYAIPTGAGRLDLALLGTWLLGHDTTLPDGSVVHRAGYGDRLLVDPSLELNASATWSLRGLAAGAALRWVGSYRECDASPCSVEPPAPGAPAPRFRTVAAWTPLDLFVRWTQATAYGTTALHLGATNVLDQDPPASHAAGTEWASDPSTYGFLGRRYFLRLAQAF